MNIRIDSPLTVPVAHQEHDTKQLALPFSIKTVAPGMLLAYANDDRTSATAFSGGTLSNRHLSQVRRHVLFVSHLTYRDRGQMFSEHCSRAACSNTASGRSTIAEAADMAVVYELEPLFVTFRKSTLLSQLMTPHLA